MRRTHSQLDYQIYNKSKTILNVKEEIVTENNIITWSQPPEDLMGFEKQ